MRQKTSLGLEWVLTTVLQLPRQNEAKRKGEQLSQILKGARIQKKLESVQCPEKVRDENLIALVPHCLLWGRRRKTKNRDGW